MNVAILLSGGTGTRLGADIPKQYIRVKDRMIITYALSTLVASSHITDICIVAATDWQQDILRDCEETGVETEKIKWFALPGKTRQDSVFQGLKAIMEDRKCSENDCVLVHDAARPLLTAARIQEYFSAIDQHDGVMPALPMKDTIYVSESGGHISKLLDREKLFAGQAPEIFRLKKYYEANEILTEEQMNRVHGSTEPAILAGMDIVMTPGDEKNFKITTQEDLERFREICLKDD